MKKSVLVLGNVYFSRQDGSEIKKGQWTRCHSYLIESGPAIVATLKGLLSLTAHHSPSFTYSFSLAFVGSSKMNSYLPIYFINFFKSLLLETIENKNFVKINCILGYMTKTIRGKCRIISKTNIIKISQSEFYKSNISIIDSHNLKNVHDCKTSKNYVIRSYNFNINLFVDKWNV